MFKKLLLLTILVTCILPLAQTQAKTGPDAYALAGYYIDTESGPGDYIGISARIEGGLWTMSKVTVNPDGGSIEPDFAYLWNVGGWIFGPIAGPNSNYAGGQHWTNYWVGAGGGILGRRFVIKFETTTVHAGVFAHAKYITPFDPNAHYEKRWQFGVTLAAGF